jgi:hypothetical protein
MTYRSKRTAGIMLLEVLAYIAIVMTVMSSVFGLAYSVQRSLLKEAIKEQQREVLLALSEHIRDDLRRAVSIDSRQALTVLLDDGSTTVLRNVSGRFNRSRSRDGKVLEQDVAPWSCTIEKIETSVPGSSKPWELDSISGKSIDLREKPVFVLITLAMVDSEQRTRRLIIGATTRVEGKP